MSYIKQGDCLELMKEIPDGSVDMVLCDLPYGVTACKWDEVIPFEKLWPEYNRIIKEHGAIVLFGTEPFSSAMRMSNKKLYRYDWIWEKNSATNFINAKRMPMRKHENISVFYKKLPTYNPQWKTITPYDKTKFRRPPLDAYYGENAIPNNVKNKSGKGYPTTIIKFGQDNTLGSNEERSKKCVHPTQKPVALLEYLIKTYTNPGETVLDNTMGSGSTCVAAVNTGREYIGFELDPGYYETAQKRITDAINKKQEEKRHDHI